MTGDPLARPAEDQQVADRHPDIPQDGIFPAHAVDGSLPLDEAGVAYQDAALDLGWES